jgi:hypothetical protein
LDQLKRNGTKKRRLFVNEKGGFEINPHGETRGRMEELSVQSNSPGNLVVQKDLLTHDHESTGRNQPRFGSTASPTSGEKRGVASRRKGRRWAHRGGREGRKGKGIGERKGKTKRG